MLTPKYSQNGSLKLETANFLKRKKRKSSFPLCAEEKKLWGLSFWTPYALSWLYADVFGDGIVFVIEG